MSVSHEAKIHIFLCHWELGESSSNYFIWNMIKSIKVQPTDIPEIAILSNIFKKELNIYF